ncbi:hypothetical protein ACWDUL_21130 [Nocardia niigatensis]
MTTPPEHEGLDAATATRSPARTARPGTPTAAAATVVDWSDLPGWIAGLDDTQRTRLLDAARDADRNDLHHGIREAVRETLDEHPELHAAEVVFGTFEHDNGYFVSDDGTVLLTDGTTTTLEFLGINELFDDLYGAVGYDFGVAVNPHTGAIRTEDHRDELLPTAAGPDHAASARTADTTPVVPVVPPAAPVAAPAAGLGG